MPNSQHSDLAPWLRLEQAAQELRQLSPAIEGEIHPLATIEGILELGEGSVIKAGCLIEGHVRIGRNCTIGPNAYIRGECAIADDCRIGHAVELKSCLIGRGVFVSHLSYIGDSILEEGVNVGGGCIFSNFRHDAAEIRMPWAGQLQPTGRDKLGAWVGAQAKIGCNSTILPGRVIHAYSQLNPATVYRGEP